jgi:hypothetical protein
MVLALLHAGCGHDKGPTIGAGGGDSTTASDGAGGTGTGGGGGGDAVVRLGIMIHLEGWTFNNPAKFADYAASLRAYADLFEKHGAKMTFECRSDHADAIVKYGDNYLEEMQSRGHGIGVHADSGYPEASFTQASFANEIEKKANELESLGVTIRHVSGICSALDWVGAAIDAGYAFSTGNVAYCAMSLDDSVQPPEYSACASPAACHFQYPVGAPHHPYRPASSQFWLDDDREGKLVLLPAGYILDGFDEEVNGGTTPLEDAVFDAADIAAFEAEIDKAIAAADPAQYNIYYVAWSFGKPLDLGVMEDWLEAVDARVKTGKLAWRTLPEMYDEYVAWEAAR